MRHDGKVPQSFDLLEKIILIISKKNNKKMWGFDLELWPWIDFSSEFLLDRKYTLPKGTYISEMMENTTIITFNIGNNPDFK